MALGGFGHFTRLCSFRPVGHDLLAQALIIDGADVDRSTLKCDSNTLEVVV